MQIGIDLGASKIESVLTKFFPGFLLFIELEKK